MAATLVVVGGCGGSVNGNPSAPALQSLGSVTLAPGGKGLARPLPPDWEITMRVWFPTRPSTLRAELGSAAVMVFDGSHIWHRVELTSRGLLVDGQRTGTSSLPAASVTLRAEHGPVDIRELVIRRRRG